MDHASQGSPSDSAAVRRRNLGLVLGHIADHGPCARSEVATATGLAHGSVTTLVGDLQERGLVREDDALRGGGRGRPGRPLRLVPERALAVAVQISAEELRVVVADLSGVIVWRNATSHRCAPGTPERMADAVAAAVRRAAGAITASPLPSDGAVGAAESRVDGPATEIDSVVSALPPTSPHAVDRESRSRAVDSGHKHAGMTRVVRHGREPNIGNSPEGAGLRMDRASGASLPPADCSIGAIADPVLVRVVIAMAGPVRDDPAQTVVVAPDFGWLHPVRLGELVADRLSGIPCPVDVINDGNAAALAEFHARPRRRRGLVLIEAGTGIGGGVVLDGRIHVGSQGIAGEPGHMPVAVDGPLCVCGAHGCLVCYAGPEAVLTAAGLGEVLRGAGLAAASDRLVAALGEDDERARAAVDLAARALGVAVLSITALLDVDEIVLGGTLAQWFPWLAPTIEGQLAGRRSLAPAMELNIVAARLGEDAILLGAIESARRTVLSDPASVPVLPDRSMI
ncbi:ROK family transcriptional regulator [Nocardia uniformis]|uniref:ROK family transcriptional regulator n=1 Tax=Nocardia uniformis TaxID=53432 RepID=A0A849C3S3_9NOCA|nr:ROK family transcriptional regulator [Nocardia uniformis]NNH72246.1 ROK family transcriptional regulator [Nocardia uniformis]